MDRRFALFTTWLLAFAISFLLLLIFAHTRQHGVQGVLTPELGPQLLTLRGIFVPHLGPIIGFWFAESKTSATDLPGKAGTVAILCSAFYNLVLVLIVSSIYLVAINLSAGGDLHIAVVEPINRRLDLAAKVAASLSFLVGPAIGIYFRSTVQFSSPKP